MKLNWRVWVLIIALILSLWIINPRPWHEGVVITAVEPISPAAAQGLAGPTSSQPPVLRERVLAVSGVPTPDLSAYFAALQAVQPGDAVQVLTSEDSYILFVPELNQTSNGTDGNESNSTRVLAPEFNSLNPLGISVAAAPTTNIRKGLDLTGGVRVLLSPTEPVEPDVMETLVESIEQRVNAFGLSNIIVRPTNDFSGNQYVLVEIPGAQQEEVIDLLTQQGNFEARIGEQVAFTGGDDITDVSDRAGESGIRACNRSGSGYFCNFFFLITLTPEAAQRQADLTGSLGVEGQYLSEPLDLFLDDTNITSLQIGASLRGRAETQIQISGSSSGLSEDLAYQAALDEMKQLKTLMRTGSLPVDVEIVKADSISPSLGSSFLKNIWLVGVVALLAVVAVVVSRYRDWKVSIPMVITMLSEVVIILAFASLFYDLDLAGIAGVLIAIGTGVDDQIIIVDEIKNGKDKKRTWKMRIKNAFFIIFASFFTLLAAMVPLISAGAGLVKGFAIVTVVGVTAGVFITRPAFAAIAERILKD